uniref:Uncharacterized protein n=1 Tax=Lepeophtheirus salmonis TaxID=72036 RepID=A0A0K2U1J5_LEPSM
MGLETVTQLNWSFLARMLIGVPEDTFTHYEEAKSTFFITPAPLGFSLMCPSSFQWL